MTKVYLSGPRIAASSRLTSIGNEVGVAGKILLFRFPTSLSAEYIIPVMRSTAGESDHEAVLDERVPKCS